MDTKSFHQPQREPVDGAIGDHGDIGFVANGGDGEAKAVPDAPPMKEDARAALELDRPMLDDEVVFVDMFAAGIRGNDATRSVQFPAQLIKLT
jgi:hypothetical protein